ncbi:hypothetical protein CRE_23170 [Caenorhabditis remanei]|uniref:Uncharacterized protein n=1 Tax=Caenorhabditis remanei TaxID=31234 RepID=E3NHU7_CAERE|nr:hypothetical protein CRE_23170 [Caenorhabditis remanei]
MGKEFDNEHFKHLTKLLKIEHVMTKGYNSRANGAVERFNKTLMHIMSKKAAVPIEWDDQIAFAVYAYNSVAHSTTGKSPMFLMSGRDSKGPLDLAGEDAVGMSYANLDEYKHLMASELAKAHALVREHAMQEQEQYKYLFDKKHNTEKRRYPVPGSRVLVEIPSEKLGARCPKLVNKWKGPYRVIACSETSATVVPVLGKGKEVLKIPFDHLRVIPAEMEDVPIETVKSRAKMRVDSVHYENMQNTQVNLITFSDIYGCRCPTSCVFYPKDAMSARTTSPTQLQRMIALTKEAPDLLLRDNARELLLATQTPIPGLNSTPDAETFLALSNCPTVALVVKDLRGWEHEYLKFRHSLLEQFLGSGFERKETIQVILAPGVTREQFPLQTMHITALTTESILEDDVHEQCEKHSTSIVVVVVPVSKKDTDLDTWRSIVNAIPTKSVVYVIPTHMSDFDHSVMAVFINLFDRIKRDHGEIVHVSPEEIVEDKQHRMLYLASEIMKAPEYWLAVKEMLEKKNRPWPQFQLASITKSNENTPQKTVSTELQPSSSAAPTATRTEGWDRGWPPMRGRGNGRGSHRGGSRQHNNGHHPYRRDGTSHRN